MSAGILIANLPKMSTGLAYVMGVLTGAAAAMAIAIVVVTAPAADGGR
jgi:hypothetical protein